MKKMKKMLAFLLAAVMILTTALSMTAFAAPDGDTPGGDEGGEAGASGRMEDDKGTIILKSTVKD